MALMLVLGCASAPRPSGTPAGLAESASGRTLGERAASTARSLVGVPYRFGGASRHGFDCSGLVVYSFARAGRLGLPHSVARLDELSRPVPIESLEPGDLLFFRLPGGHPRAALVEGL